MPGLRPHLEHGPETYTANVTILGGQLVEPDSTTGRIKPAAAGSVVCLGLAIGDAAAYNATGMVAATQDAWGRYTAGAMTPPSEVAVAYRGSWWIKNTSGGTLAFGARLICAAAGAIAASGATPDARTVIGVVIEPGGIANNAEGRVRLTIR
jgi:hypothetical protein